MGFVICGIVALIVIGSLVALCWYRPRRESVELTDDEVAVIEKIGYPCSAMNCGTDIKGQYYQRRRFSGTDLASKGVANWTVVNSYGSTAGGTLIWGGDGNRFHVAFADGTVATVPFDYNDRSCTPEHRNDGIPLGLYLHLLSPELKPLVTHIVLEEWQEDEGAPGRTVAFVDLTFLTDFWETLLKLPEWRSCVEMKSAAKVVSSVG